MSTVFSGTLFNTLKKTLQSIVDDKTDGLEASIGLNKWCKVEDMDDQWVDDLEVAGPGLAAEVAEGQEIPLGAISEGYITRYLARKFGLKLIVTDEVMEDNKYPESIKAARRLKRSLVKTMDIDASLMKVRGFDTNYVGGDGQPLWSASHTLARGGTFSNIMAVPASPSVAALIIARAQLMKMPGHDGIREGYEPDQIWAPVDQWGAWSVILNSMGHPDPGEFNAINVVNRDMSLELVLDKFWSNTETNWALRVKVENGVKFLHRRRARSRTWVENDNETMKYAITARWARGWSDPRGSYGVNA